ncbi:hypothetical protein HDU87_002045 [Geranomyces variabilis]|uniref:Uncharacterized protein n=1 Tax=Geranomyces variabilis TaxID=109894 RepID=A0AAD5TLZ3_9FUNG|nr:hypothetical protein HDU87_002045 [Geranomyces variabilis]
MDKMDRHHCKHTAFIRTFLATADEKSWSSFLAHVASLEAVLPLASERGAKDSRTAEFYTEVKRMHNVFLDENKDYQVDALISTNAKNTQQLETTLILAKAVLSAKKRPANDSSGNEPRKRSVRADGMFDPPTPESIIPLPADTVANDEELLCQTNVPTNEEVSTAGEQFTKLIERALELRELGASDK